MALVKVKATPTLTTSWSSRSGTEADCSQDWFLLWKEKVLPSPVTIYGGAWLAWYRTPQQEQLAPTLQEVSGGHPPWPHQNWVFKNVPSQGGHSYQSHILLGTDFGLGGFYRLSRQD